ncbi:hypothetical protein [Streptomyces sp. NPDC050738]
MDASFAHSVAVRCFSRRPRAKDGYVQPAPRRKEYPMIIDPRIWFPTLVG